MLCNNCGFETSEPAEFCPNCGRTLSKECLSTNEYERIPCNPIKERFLNAFKDNMFLSLCILVSISSALQIVFENLPLFTILFTIFLWIIFASSKKDEVNDKMMRCVSGTIYAQKIVLIVAGGLIALCVAAICSAFALVGGSIDFYEIFSEAVDISGLDIPLQILQFTSSVLIVVFIFALVLIIAVLVINFIGLHKIHTFAKSLYTNAQNNVFMPEKADAAKNWLLAFAIFAVISAFGSITDLKSFIANGLDVAIYILAYLLVRKHFSEDFNQP